MGMQSLKTKIRKRKYKLGLGRRGGSDDESSSAFTNAGSEWEFENFVPWSTTCDAKQKSDYRAHCGQVEEESGGANSAGRPPSPPPPPVPPRTGILSYFPRRPSSWTPASQSPSTCGAAPPVPLHSWQIRPCETGSDGDVGGSSGHLNSLSPAAGAASAGTGSRNYSSKVCGSNPDLKRSKSSFGDPKSSNEQLQHSSAWDVRHVPPPSKSRGSGDAVFDGHSTAASQSRHGSSHGGCSLGRLKRVANSFSSGQNLASHRKESAVPPAAAARPLLEPIYSVPHRSRPPKSKIQGEREKGPSSAPPNPPAAPSPMPAAQCQTSGSLSRESIANERDGPTVRSGRLSCGRTADRNKPPIDQVEPDDIPPAVPPHAPGVVCTRIAMPPPPPSPPPLPPSPPLASAPLGKKILLITHTHQRT